MEGGCHGETGTGNPTDAKFRLEEKVENRSHSRNSRSVRTTGRGLISVTFALFLLTGCQQEALPTYGEVVPFSLTDHNGKVFQSDSMKGKTWVVSFFFSRCKTICPPLLNHLSGVLKDAERVGIPLQVVSITVDPEHDSPDKLATKHREIGAGENWRFLTGNTETIRTVVVDGFKTHMGEEEVLEDGLIEIGHGAKLMLIDSKGKIRGLFGSDPVDRLPLIEAAKSLQ